MRTALPAAISNVEEAKTFLTELNNNGEVFHPEDNANELVGDLFTKEEGDKLNKLMSEILSLESFDACDFILSL